jgi:hypothetical protein
MNDAMSFPATVDEFMEQYKIVDCDHVYSNGMEMVPIFRMKQWFEHEANHNADVSKKEIIHCKDCRYYGRADKRRFYRGSDCLNKRIDTIVPDRDFCSRAERRGEDVDGI